MPVNSKEKQKQLSDAWYRKNRESHIINTARNKRRYKDEWIAFKSTLQCSHCGFSHPAAIDFHHVIRDKDKESVNGLVSQGRFAAAREEIKKCIPLCANCHRILHWDEDKAKQGAKKYSSQPEIYPPTPDAPSSPPVTIYQDAESGLQEYHSQPKQPQTEPGL